MGRYDNEISYDRTTINGEVRKSLTIRKIDREVDLENSIIHVVKDGENLFGIARTYYDDFEKWYKIADKNPSVQNPFSLEIGTQLIVPDVYGGDS